MLNNDDASKLLSDLVVMLKKSMLHYEYCILDQDKNERLVMYLNRCKYCLSTLQQKTTDAIKYFQKNTNSHMEKDFRAGLIVHLNHFLETVNNEWISEYLKINAMEDLNLTKEMAKRISEIL